MPISKKKCFGTTWVFYYENDCETYFDNKEKLRVK